MDSCTAATSDTTLFPETPDSASVERFRAFLQRCELAEDRVPTVAVPGLSKHGQLRAFDFKIKEGRRIVAGTLSATIPTVWDNTGWTDKLYDAVMSVSDRFVGPLPSPYEPWHYNYCSADDYERTEKSISETSVSEPTSGDETLSDGTGR